MTHLITAEFRRREGRASHIATDNAAPPRRPPTRGGSTTTPSSSPSPRKPRRSA